MDEKRRQEYLKLIEKLINSSSNDELNKILTDNLQIIDEGFLQTLEAAAQTKSDDRNQNTANLLRAIANALREALGFSPSVPKPSPTVNVEHNLNSLREEEIQVYLQFLLQILQAIDESKGDTQVVYPLLAANIDKLDANLAEILRRWATSIFEKVEKKEAKSIGLVLGGFSDLIQQFPLGNKANNMEIAITGYEVILTFFTKDAFPEIWALLQNNLGNAYRERIKGDKADNIEKAIAAYNTVLEVRTRNDFPQDWAMTQNNLGLAYNIRIKGNKADNIEKAIAAYSAALEIRTRKDSPQYWATIQNNLGNAYRERIKGNKADNIEKAIAAYSAALEIRARKDSPQYWADTQNNLGNAYWERIKGDKADNIEKAIAAYNAALEVRTRNDFPQYWAMTQNNLVGAYSIRIKGDKADNIEKAIAAGKAALEVYTRNDFPYEWAMTQNNLVGAYSIRIKGDKADNIENAIAACKAALEVCTRNDFPYEWARMQIMLGIAYWDRIKGDKADNTEKAIAAYNAALEVRTRKNFPQDWADTQNNLGTAYWNRIKGDKADNIEKAIAAYNAALEVRTRNDFPQDWAMTQNNLGAAYTKRIKGDKADNIEKAIAAYNAVLEVRTRNDFPKNWADTQNNLGLAYNDRIKGDKADNIELAINSFQNALIVLTPAALPIECLNTARSLGYLLLQKERWQEAIKAYDKAIQAVELSRNWATYDSRRQEILEEAIVIYANTIQACIYNKQPALAIEYAERSKARNLVELLTARDLNPKGDIPQEIINELDRLRKEIRVEQTNLSHQTKPPIQDANKDKNQIKAENQKWEASRQHLEQLQQQLDELIKRDINPYDPSFSLTQKVKSIKFAEIQSLLDERTAIIEWYITAKRIVAFIVTQALGNKDKLTIWQSQPKDLETLFDWKEEYLKNYYTPSKKEQWQNGLDERLKELAEILHIDELIVQIPKNCDRLILIPHNFLHIFPLHALKVKNKEYKSNKCLLELFPGGVSYAPSCQLLQLAQNQQRNDFTSLFAIQTPTKDLYEKDLGAVAAIKRQFTDSYISKKSNAKKSSILTDEKFLTANNAFFFCHGFFKTESPLDSGLILADDYLTLDDLFTQLKLENCRLVTLSACETGLVDFNNTSDEYIGLPSGFIFAGSTNVVSSLWTVNAVATALLMIKFYEELQQQNSIVLSLNKAQLWLRDSTIEGFQDWLKTSSLSNVWKIELDKHFAQIKAEEDAAYKPYESPYFWSAFCAIGKGE